MSDIGSFFRDFGNLIIDKDPEREARDKDLEAVEKKRLAQIDVDKQTAAKREIEERRKRQQQLSPGRGQTAITKRQPSAARSQGTVITNRAPLPSLFPAS